MLTWLPVTVGILAVAASILLLTGWLAARRWDRETELIRARLLARCRDDQVVYSERLLDGLPPPVARYFRHTLQDGQRLVSRVRITWIGTFNMGAPGADKWAPFTAVQDFVPGAPGMVWDARIRMAPGVAVRVRDAFVDGTGSMYGAVFGLFPVVNKAGTPDMARASLQRYLAEAAWLPTALLPAEGVHWTPLDDTRAVATLATAGEPASVEFRFNADGRIASTFVPDRLFDNGKAPPSRQAWQGRNLSFTTVDGVVVPDEAMVEWLLPEGPYAYWRGRPVTVRYEYAGPPPAPH